MLVAARLAQCVILEPEWGKYIYSAKGRAGENGWGGDGRLVTNWGRSGRVRKEGRN